MRLPVVIFATLISACFASSSNLRRPRRQAACRGLTVAGVRCVTTNQFVMGFQDINKDQPTECPRGSVCADVEEICSRKDRAVCENKPVGIKGVCNKCPSDVEYNPVCVTDSEYAFCADERIQSGMRYKCLSGKPYCRAEFNANFTLKSICSAEPIGTDCPRRPTADGSGGGSYIGGSGSSFNSGSSSSFGGSPSSGGGGSAFKPTVSNPPCTSDGWFPDKRDMTCRNYHRCLPAANGKFIKIDFKCVTMNSIFNPEANVCVSDGSYICPT